LSKGPSDKQTAGKYVLTNQGDMLLVHLTDTAIASANEKAEQNKKPVAFFRAPAPIRHSSAPTTRSRWAVKTARCCTCGRPSWWPSSTSCAPCTYCDFVACILRRPFFKNLALTSGISIPYIFNNSVYFLVFVCRCTLMRVVILYGSQTHVWYLECFEISHFL